MNQIKNLRQLAIDLLDDENGICEAGYLSLQNLISDTASGSCDDIWGMVFSVGGRTFLPEDHGIVA